MAYIYTFSLCQNKEMAEDIVSQSFEKAFLSLEDGKQDFKYWILVVCKNLWIDILRKNKHVWQGSFEVNQIASEEDTVKRILKKESYNQLYKAISRLPYKYREILILHYFSDISLTQIALLLGMKNSNVKTIICRARVKVKTYLEEEADEF